jgi:hypothetical protein
VSLLVFLRKKFGRNHNLRLTPAIAKQRISAQPASTIADVSKPSFSGFRTIHAPGDEILWKEIE